MSTPARASVASDLTDDGYDPPTSAEVLQTLADEGKVKKEGRGWHPVG